tara:strand:+ start:2140 stop:2919 length:780 start_codon:yes stop_codon:yes gene_type:complete
MAIQSNASTEEVVGGIKTYSGLTNVNVIAVNPSMAELHALDINVKQEPNYTVTIGDQDYNKITFWVKNTESSYRFDILVQPNIRVSQSGKNQWMNSVGQATWSENEPEYEWFKKDGLHKAYVGEETLINFVKAWANVRQGDEVSFDTLDNIVKGNVSELKELVKVLKDNQVRVLMGVKDDKYQTIYTKYFGRVKPQRDDLFIKALNDDYGQFNADFNADLVWGEHKSTASLITPDSNGQVTSEDEEWSTEDQKKADLPF